ncbi:MAG: hypothetical protein ACFCGT_17615 [Sandaracinaceae bacterium]
MAKQRRKKKRRSGRGRGGPGAGGSAAPQGGGLLQGMRSSFRQMTGAEAAKDSKPSTLGNVLWLLLLLGAAAFAIYRWTR